MTREKVSRGDSLNEGKKKMGFKVYELICQKLFNGADEEYAIGHLFLVLQWNLMARSENVADCHAENITWHDDALCFNFPKTKCDQKGKRSDALWHVYATPNNPVTCPILSLARFLFSNPGTLSKHHRKAATSVSANGYSKLFEGSSQYSCFSNILKKVIIEHEDEFRKMGVEEKDMGSHSARKGACSHALAGSTVAPPIVSICLRAMWSMGSVKERYLHYEKAGDQYLGRVVSEMDVSCKTFAVSPPYFDFSSVLNAEEKEKDVDKLLLSFIVTGGTVCPRVYKIFCFCFASLCFHAQYMKENVKAVTKINGTPLFNMIPIEIQRLAVVRYPWNATAFTPNFTGQFILPTF